MNSVQFLVEVLCVIKKTGLFNVYKETRMQKALNQYEQLTPCSLHLGSYQDYSCCVNISMMPTTNHVPIDLFRITMGLTTSWKPRGYISRTWSVCLSHRRNSSISSCTWVISERDVNLINDAHDSVIIVVSVLLLLLLLMMMMMMMIMMMIMLIIMTVIVHSLLWILSNNYYHHHY